jgi:cytochrome c
MKINLWAICLIGITGPGLPASAVDPERGAQLFEDCRACHTVTDQSGRTIIRGGRTGPNLHGVIGRHAGSVPGFHYSVSMTEAGRRGLRWNEADFVVYVRDATEFLREYLDDPTARGKMAYKLPDAEKARDVWSYLERIATP